ncbi:MAG: NmrA family NAD(P)-binding protein [Actinobacteria bacterium]|nr:NmrA family NAD(P)-binding protein [Actinomycetota bacterium]
MPSNTVLLTGATGMLGARIAHHLLEAEDVALRLLVRSAAFADPDKRSGLDPLVERGAELVEGDVTDAASLDRGTDGVDVVVSTLQGGREVVVDGQIALARAAASNGVRRILPSDFALDLFKASPGEHPAFDLRREADEAIGALGIEQIHVLNGAFLDMIATGAGIVEFDDEAGVASFWGTGEERFDATTVDDTARYAARVAVDASVPSGKFAVAGQQLSFGEIVSAVERGTGRRYARRSRGTTEDLRAWIADQREAGETTAAMYGTYQLYMLTGQTALDDLQNDRYPDIEPVTLAQLSAEKAA